jgi:predicted transcriptional regulator of viral defense system
MAMGLLLKKLRIDGKEFVKDDDLRRYCKTMDLDYTAAVKYLSVHGHLVRVFRGIFYVKTPDEEELGRTRYTPLELVAKGLELKDVKNWYFGLNTALKLNNMTHEHYAIDYVVSDKLFRAKPIGIAGYKFRFVKLSPRLLGFGVKIDGVRYSDPEKTVLDFVYTWRYNGVPKEKILLDIKEWSGILSKTTLRKYSENYPKTVRGIVKAIM